MFDGQKSLSFRGRVIRASGTFSRRIQKLVKSVIKHLNCQHRHSIAFEVGVGQVVKYMN